MKNVFISLAIVLTVFTAAAQKPSLGPHGGRIKLTDMYHIESVGCENYLEIYLYNEKMEPIFNNGIRGEIKFHVGNKILNTPLTLYGIDGFTAKIESPDFSFYEITFELLEKLVIKAKFDNECVIQQ